MAGGTFTLSSKKVRPGTYVNVQSGAQEAVGAGLAGAVVLPLLAAPYGPGGEFIEISAEAPDANYEKLGLSVYDKYYQAMRMIRETLKGCGRVYAFIPAEGAKATATLNEKLTVTAKYGGTLGNSFVVSIVANAAAGTGFFNVIIKRGTITLDTILAVKTIGDLDGKSAWCDFTPAGSATAATALVANAGTTLAGGEAGAMTNDQFTAMLDASEALDYNVFAFPYSSTTYGTLCAAIASKMKYFAEEAGKEVFAVMSKYAADYEFCIDVDSSGVKLTDGYTVTGDQCVCFIAGATAGASYTESNTYRVYPGAASIVTPKTHEEAVAAIEAGKVFFSYDDDRNVVIEYDINSLTTFTEAKTEDYRKMRVQRVLAQYRALIRANFPPNRFDNDEDGWDVMEGIGRGIHYALEEEGAIHDYEPETDFRVDRSRSSGDQTYFDVALSPTDSAEKLYFSVATF